MNNTIKFANWQAPEIKNGFFSVMAGVRLVFENARRHRAARIAGWMLIAALVMTLEWIIAARVEQGKAQALYTERVEQFKADYLDQQDAARRGMPIDPKEEQKKAEITALAQFIQAVKRFNFSFDDYVTAAWGMDARTRNPAYPNTLLEVIQQPRQWPGYSEDIIPTKEEYSTATRVWDVLNGAEHPEVSSDFVFASFESEGITLRDTWEISTKTHFWKWSAGNE
jgi:spore germination cell wall hydrolase CwlJ-like protein